MPGTTILQAFKRKLSKSSEIIFIKDIEDLKKIKKDDLCIVVIGESPYAEFYGDRVTPQIDEEDLFLFNQLIKRKPKIVTILIIGRPVDLKDILENSSALVSAWLPGTEGEGVTDVLLGEYNFEGKLSFSWKLKNDDKAIFPFGFGLRY
ncbi:MAG: hypothetical protein CBR30_09425 [Dictyoglomus sp. NZ13-RE01]|nr:MAG: hypothetical protein CBR30_09425 [Dictyoglomus sp. NZ13-RE01]